MPELPPLPPGFSLDGAPSGPVGGPVMGAPPRVDPYKVRDQQLQEEAAARAVEDQNFQRQKFEYEKAHPGGKDTGSEQKGLSFTQRALAANRDYEATGMGARSIPSNIIHETIPGIQKSYLPEALGGDSVKRQIADANQLAFVNAVLRSDSGANAPEQEVERYVQQFFPQPGETDPSVISAKRQLRLEAIEGLRATAGPLAAQIDAHQAAPPVPGNEFSDKSRNLAEITAPSADQITTSKVGTQTVDNPALTGVRGEYLRRLESNQSPQEIVNFLRQAGISDPKILASAVQQANYRKQYPTVPLANYNTSSLDDMDVPLSGVEGAMNTAAQSAPGAYAMHAGNAATMNNLDSIVGAAGGNAERARIGLEDAGNTHPGASLLGDVSGGITAALGAEAGLGAAGMGAGVGRALIADTAYGAGAGAGAADEGDRLGGAVRGGLAGLAGSVAGQGIAGLAGAAISPTGGRLSDLYASGVRPTPGQRMIAAGGGKGLSGLVGRAVNATEEGISSVPIVGSAIRGARQEARDQFQIGAYNQALEEVGKKLPDGMATGTAPYSFTKKVFNEAYDKARSGMKIPPDQELASEVGELSGRIGTLAEPSVKRFQSIIQNVLLRRTGDVIDGASFKTIQSELSKIRSGIRKNQTGDGELADVLGDLQGILDRAARRHSDPAAVKLLDQADAGYAKFVRIRDAAKARGGEAGEFSPTQFDRSVQKNTSGAHSDAYLRGDALMQDYAQQGMSLVDRIPNSGTAERIAVGGTMAGGAAYLEPTTLGVLGILGALYAPGVRKVVSGAMAPRGPAAKALADQVRKRARIAGAGGAAIASQTSGDQ